MDRNRRRRQRSAHIPRGVHLTDTVVIDAKASRKLLDSGQQIDDATRLMLEDANRRRDGVMTFGELRRTVLKELTGKRR
jgi:hypothetical protein